MTTSRRKTTPVQVQRVYDRTIRPWLFQTTKNTQVTTTKLKRLDSSGLADSIAKLIEKIRTKFVLRSGTRQVRRNLATERTISQAS